LLYNELSWPTLADRRAVAKLKFMYKLFHNYVPDYFSGILPNRNSNYTLRNHNDVQNFATRTEKFRKSLIPDCIRKWNALSPNVRNIDSYLDFVKEISIPCNPNVLYYGTSRKASVIHAQFRMKCSNLRSHLFGLHVVDSPFCLCSDRIEDCSHFFFHCFLHHVPRTTLMEQLYSICTNLEITTDLLLYGSDMLPKHVNNTIFSIVETYILDSGRF
jgi:hypothetical protein